VKELLQSGNDGEAKPRDTKGVTKTTKGANAIPVLNTPLVDGSIDSLLPGSGVDINGTHPRVLKHLMGMGTEFETATGNKLPINSAKRSTEKQRQLRAKFGSGAARPGYSTHEFGLAIDIDGKHLDTLEELGLLRKYGFTRPIGAEKWHIEPAVVQMDVNKAKHDPAFADAATAASVYKGGGGLGLIPGVRKYSRDKNAQIASINAKDIDVAPTKSNVIDLATKRVPVNKPQADVNVNNIPTTRPDLSTPVSVPSSDASIGTTSRTPVASQPVMTGIGTTAQAAPIIKVEPIINVSAVVDLDKSKHLTEIALMSSRAVDLQTQMLNALGEISGKLDRDLNETPTAKPAPQSIVERMPDQVVNLRRRTAYN